MTGELLRSLVLALYGGALLLLALRSLRARRLKERYVILFFFIALPFVVLALWPDLLGMLATQMKLPYHTLMIMLLAGCLILVIFELLSIVSVQDRKITHLAQHVGLLDQELRQLKKTPPGRAADGAEAPADDQDPAPEAGNTGDPGENPTRRAR